MSQDIIGDRSTQVWVCTRCGAEKRIGWNRRLKSYRLGDGSCGKGRRTLDDIKEEVQPEDIYRQVVEGKPWPYVTTPEFYWTRDKALMALLYLTAGRVSEVLELRRRNFKAGWEPNFITVVNMPVKKRKKEGVIRGEIGLPLKGRLAPFTQLVQDYLELLENVDEGIRLFPFKAGRAYQIVRHATGLWNHFFRSQAETFYGDAFSGDLLTLARFVGIKNLDTLGRYVKTGWKRYRDRILR